MKIKLAFGYFVRINRQFKSKKVIIPIGYDCHPAYVLQKTTLRKESFPFDWMLTEPEKALDYAYSNIKNDFKYFMQNLTIDSKGDVIAQKYPEAAFYHFKDLRDNTTLQKKISKRCNNVLNTIKTKNVSYLFVVPSIHLNSDQAVECYYESIKRFLTILKQTDDLLVYVRCENSDEENRFFRTQLFQKISGLSQLNFAVFVLESDKYGLWANQHQYRSLLADLKMDYYQIAPSIRLEKK